MPEPEACKEPREWVSLAETARILGRSVDVAKNAAISGAIRSRVLPGARPLYSRPDAERLAGAGSQATNH
jgi:hypothetical protein